MSGILFTKESYAVMKKIEAEVRERVHCLLAELLAKDGRTVITNNDVCECYAAAFCEHLMTDDI